MMSKLKVIPPDENEGDIILNVRSYHFVFTVRSVNSTCTGGHLIIGRTQLSDATSYRALQTQICEI